jgi:hypothetical protein
MLIKQLQSEKIHTFIRVPKETAKYKTVKYKT